MGQTFFSQFSYFENFLLFHTRRIDEIEKNDHFDDGFLQSASILLIEIFTKNA